MEAAWLDDSYTPSSLLYSVAKGTSSEATAFNFKEDGGDGIFNGWVGDGGGGVWVSGIFCWMEDDNMKSGKVGKDDKKKR